MRRTALILTVALLGLAGCQSTHQANKKAALERWQNARSQMSLDMARQQFQTGELDKALQSALRALELGPENTDALVLLAQISLEQNQPGQAEKYLQKCLDLNPRQAAAHYHLATVYQSWGAAEAAAEHYRKAYELKPESPAYLQGVVESMVQQKKTREALDLLLSSMSRIERHSALYSLAGNLYSALGDEPSASKMYRQAIHMDPQKAMLYELLAYSLHRQGLYQQALDELEQRAGVATPETGGTESLACLAVQADCYFQLQQYHKAQRTLEQLTQQDPRNTAAWKQLAQTALARNDYAKAQSWIQRSLTLEPEQTDGRFLLGYALLKQQQYEAAAAEFRKVIEQQPDHALAHCCLGQAYQGLGQPDRARESYQRALELNPQDALSQKLHDSLKADGIQVSQATP